MTKICKATFAAGWFTFVLISANAFPSETEASIAKIESANLENVAAGKISVPFQISPVLIEAPIPQIDLMAGQGRKRHGSFLSGFPVNLYEFPTLKLGQKNVNSDAWGLNLELDSHHKGRADYLVHIGNPNLFPDMLDAHIDFHLAEFTPKRIIYSLMRKAGMGGDEKWHYSPMNATVTGISKGVAIASFVPGGDLVLTKAFDSLNIENAPLIDYEFSLPEKGEWNVYINAKVDIGALNRNVLLLSRKFTGAGKQKILLNLKELLHDNYPHTQRAILKDLVIHFVLDPTSVAVKDASIDLGLLSFYRIRQSTEGDIPNTLLIDSVDAEPIDLIEKLEHLGVAGNFTALRGSLAGNGQENITQPDALPEISLRGVYREKIPKLFVGDSVYLDSLSASNLRAVLNQKLFLETAILWQADQDKDVFLNPALPDTNTLIEYTPNVDVDDATYLQVNYDVPEGATSPLYLTVSGINPHGKWLYYDRLLENNTPIKLEKLRLKKISIAYKHGGLSTTPPSYVRFRKIQIHKIRMSQIYHTQKSLVRIALEGHAKNEALPNSKMIWEAAPERINFTINNKEAFQTVKRFAINQKITSNSFVHVDLSPTGNVNWYLRVNGRNKETTYEQLFPLSNQCVVQLTGMELQSIDLVAQTNLDDGLGQIQINKLEINLNSKTPPRVIWSAPLGQREIKIRGSADLLTAAKLPVDKKITGGAMLDYAIKLSSGPAMSYLLRMRGKNELGEFERLIPLALEGSLPLTDMYLHSLDFVIKGGDGALTTTVLLNRMILREADGIAKPKFLTIDASMTYAEILKGGKLIQSPQVFMEQGGYRLDYVASNDLNISIAPSYRPVNQALAPNQTRAIVNQSNGLKVLAYIGGLLAAILLFITGRKLVLRLLPPETYPRLYSTCIGIVVFALLVTASYVVFKSGHKDAFSWGGIILLISYGLLVRWKVRPWLIRSWPEVSDRLSAPYFLLFFILLLLCALSLLFDFELVAERIAEIAYFFLLAGVAVEFIQFARTASNTTVDP